MLFRKKIDPSCAYCIHAAKLDGDTMLCSKKGPVSILHKCLSFRYDPCKRIPVRPKALDFSKYDEEDYSL